MKGELERDVLQLPFQHTAIMRPGMLSGDRTEDRTGEKIALKVVNVLKNIPGLDMLKPIQGASVAKAMIMAARQQNETKRIYEMKELFALAEQYNKV
jgi:hypothetical protein